MKIFFERLVRIILAIPEFFITYFPGPLGRLMRFYYWKCRMRYVGKRVTFGIGIQISNPEYISIGDNTWIDDYVVLLAGPPGQSSSKIFRKVNSYYTGEEGYLYVGANCHIAQFVTLQAHGGVLIGDNSGVASGSKIYSLSHHYESLCGQHGKDISFKFTPQAPANEQALILAPVVMQHSTALGLNSVMLPGSTIREGSWVGVMSLVLGEIPPNSIAFGTPAKCIKFLR
jgi:acetyltransferase-like isoleucine patch superfamily enzyme